MVDVCRGALWCRSLGGLPWADVVSVVRRRRPPTAHRKHGRALGNHAGRGEHRDRGAGRHPSRRRRLRFEAWCVCTCVCGARTRPVGGLWRPRRRIDVAAAL